VRSPLNPGGCRDAKALWTVLLHVNRRDAAPKFSEPVALDRRRSVELVHRIMQVFILRSSFPSLPAAPSSNGYIHMSCAQVLGTDFPRGGDQNQEKKSKQQGPIFGPPDSRACRATLALAAAALFFGAGRRASALIYIYYICAVARAASCML
jgi:hypothetical protein